MAPLALVILGGCGGTALPDVLPDPVTREGEELRSLWRLSNIFAVVVGLVVVAYLAWVLVVQRRRRRGGELPVQAASHIPTEVVYTAIPVAIVAILFGFSYGTQREVTDPVDDPDVVVDVVAFSWGWQFRYPGEGVVVTGTGDDPPEMVLPVGSTARLRLRTTDVIHSFWVPRFLTKRDVIPGIDNEIDVTVTEGGRWPGVCAEFCGIDHYRMTFSVRATSPAGYAQWLSARRGGPAFGDRAGP